MRGYLTLSELQVEVFEAYLLELRTIMAATPIRMGSLSEALVPIMGRGAKTLRPVG